MGISDSYRELSYLILVINELFMIIRHYQAIFQVPYGLGRTVRVRKPPPLCKYSSCVSWTPSHEDCVIRAPPNRSMPVYSSSPRAEHP